MFGLHAFSVLYFIHINFTNHRPHPWFAYFVCKHIARNLDFRLFHELNVSDDIYISRKLNVRRLKLQWSKCFASVHYSFCPGIKKNFHFFLIRPIIMYVFVVRDLFIPAMWSNKVEITFVCFDAHISNTTTHPPYGYIFIGSASSTII